MAVSEAQGVFYFMAAPIGHTCPDIDKAIRVIRDTRETLKRYIHEDSDLDWEHHYLGDVIDMLEDLRKSNDTLRSYGEDMENKNEELQEKLDAIRDIL